MAQYCAQAHCLMNELEASGAQGWSRRSIGHPFSFCSRIIWVSPRMRHLPTTSCTGCWKIRELEGPRGIAVPITRSASPEGQSSGRKARLSASGEIWRDLSDTSEELHVRPGRLGRLLGSSNKSNEGTTETWLQQQS